MAKNRAKTAQQKTGSDTHEGIANEYARLKKVNSGAARKILQRRLIRLGDTGKRNHTS